MNEKNLISRSNFLRNGISHLVEYFSGSVSKLLKESAGKTVIPLHRPPGAVDDELEFLSNCTRCDLCIEACPHKALTRADAKFGAAVGTPMIVPEDNPCYMCADYPCIAVCPEPALSLENSLVMGTAHIINSKCYAHAGQICDYCYDSCPLKDEAIIMDNKKPMVFEKNCTGCGLCEYYCPVPGNAILIIPKRKFSGES
ncbi:MAG TPA: 4Fe-4S dicluster domain-containing protein [bacterium]|nr:4Fe-4S dicluster domain-containing protein [bacterium]